MGGGYLKLKDTNTNASVNAGTLEEENLVGVYIQNGDDYEKSDTVPEYGYILNDEASYCKVGEDEVEVTFSYDTSTKTLSVSPITSSGTKCYLYFDVEPMPLKDAILANSVYGTGTSNFANASCSNGCEEATVGLYQETTSKGTTYYFRGDVEDNYVEFAGFYWRIIRVNEDGSVRLIYSGNKEEVDAAGRDSIANGYNDGSTGYTQIGTSAFNTTIDRSEDVGYTYSEGYQRPSDNPSGETNSTIKGVLDNWYSTNIGNNPDYDSKVVSSAGFCNDREMAIGYTWSSTGSTIYYKVSERLGYVNWDLVDIIPTFECSNTNDLYTVKIGLVTADEIIYAGGLRGYDNQGYYLYTGNMYWTMSPLDYSGGSAHIAMVTRQGGLTRPHGAYSSGVRPVINLSADVTISSGNSTISSPYVV